MTIKRARPVSKTDSAPQRRQAVLKSAQATAALRTARKAKDAGTRAK